MARSYPPNYSTQESEPTTKVIRRRTVAPFTFRSEGPVQLDPIWREAKELGTENEYGSMMNPVWDRGPMPEPRQGTWAQTPDHYFRYHSARVLQCAWRSSSDENLHVELSPEPSQRDIENCLMNTPDCQCRCVLLDSFQNPPHKGRFSYDPNEADLGMLPSTNRPPGYVCAGRDHHKHIRIRSVSLQGFVTPLTSNTPQGLNRTFFEPEEVGSSQPLLPQGPSVATGQSRSMTDDDLGPADEKDEDAVSSRRSGPIVVADQSTTMVDDNDVLGTLEFLSGQKFCLSRDEKVRQEPAESMDWNTETLSESPAVETDGNAEPELPDANRPVGEKPTQLENVEQQIELDAAEIDTQLRRPRQGQYWEPDVDEIEAWRNVRNDYFWDSVQRAIEQENSWEALAKLREAYYGPLELPPPTTAEDERMQDVTSPELLDYGEEVGSSAVNWAPQSGDVIILKSCRHGIPWPGFEGKVEIYVDEKEHRRNPLNDYPWSCWFEEGDVIVRFGSYLPKWHWTQAPQVRVYQYREGKVFLVARQTMQPLYPMEYKFVDPKEKAPHQKDFRFKPRWGDLIINRGVQFPFVWYIYWWDEGMPVRPSDLLVRAAYDEDQNLSYCDAELYLRNPDPDFPGNWIFLGKDDYCFTRTDQFVFNDDDQSDRD